MESKQKEGKQKEGIKELNKNAFIPRNVQNRIDEANKTITIEIKGGNGEKKEIQHKLPPHGAFIQYEDIEVISRYIISEFINEKKEIVFKSPDEPLSNIPYTKIIEEGLTFFMSSEQGEDKSGLLSICPAVLTAMKLWAKLPSTSTRKPKLLDNIRTGIDAMLKMIYRDVEQKLDDDAPVFGATPFEYDVNSFTKGLNGRSYIDSISWAVPVFLRILNLTDKEGNFAFIGKVGDKENDSKLLDTAKFLAKWCLRYVNNSVIRDETRPIGWNFTKLDNPEGAERSLYFTYAASTIYLSFYAEFDKIIDALRNLDDIDKKTARDGFMEINLNGNYWEDTDNLKEKLEKIENFLDEKKNSLDEESKKPEGERDRRQIDELEEKIEKFSKIKKDFDVLLDSKNAEKIKTFMEFNDHKRVNNEPKSDDNSLSNVGEVLKLKWYLLQVSEGIWEKVGTRIEDKFFYDDYEATEAEQGAIKSGGQTNALFTGLLQIGILLNSAYDQKIKNENKKLYDRMVDAMLLHTQKTQRFFDDLEEDGKAFGVDTLILRFSEKINDDDKGEQDDRRLSDKALAEKMRKHEIRVSSLTPLLLKTNNILSEYVIQYPQKQMGESLLRISQKRYYDADEGKVHWLWESDNYNAVATYYYVDAIFSFYDYYEKYEHTYIKRYENMRKDFIRDAQYDAGVSGYCERIQDEFEEKEKKYKKELQEKENDIEIANKKLKEREGIDEFGILWDKIIKSTSYFDSVEFYSRILRGMRECLAAELVKRYKAFKTESEDSLKKLNMPAALSINKENIVNNGEIFSLLQALLVDVILPSAIADKRKTDGEGTVKLGMGFRDDIKAAEIAYEGRKKMLDDGLANTLFADMFKQINWKGDQK